MNLYRYVGNGPGNGRDPWGLVQISETANVTIPSRTIIASQSQQTLLRQMIAGAAKNADDAGAAVNSLRIVATESRYGLLASKGFRSILAFIGGAIAGALEAYNGFPVTRTLYHQLDPWLDVEVEFSSRISSPNRGDRDHDCSRKRLWELQQAVDFWCDSFGARKCKGTDLLDDLIQKIKLYEECISARKLVMDECFNGGDDGHIEKVEQEESGLQRCRDFYDKKSGVVLP